MPREERMDAAAKRSKDFADSAATIALLLRPEQKEDLFAGKTIRVRLNALAVIVLSLEDELGRAVAADLTGAVTS